MYSILTFIILMCCPHVLDVAVICCGLFWKTCNEQFFLTPRLRDETSMFLREREKFQKKLEKHVIFQKYLYKVVESAEEFHEIREIIARYDTLTATHEVRTFYNNHYYCRIPIDLSQLNFAGPA